MRSIRTGFSVLCLALFACSAPKDTTMDGIRQALTRGDCDTALTEVLPLYNSASSTTEIRMLAASSYACAAGVDFFNVINSFSSNGSALSGGGFWALLAQDFPSTSADRHVESGNLGMDALMSALKTTAIVTGPNRVNWTTYNPGSISSQDRVDDANLYMAFMSISVLGGLQSRYGSPNPTTYIKTVDLPWKTATTVTSDGCAYASAMVNFADALGSISQSVTGPLSGSFQTLQQTFQTLIYSACDVGCRNVAGPAGPGGAWGQSGCTVTTACSSCPTGLRFRGNCQAANNDQVSCAAAGITNFINTQSTGWN